jgi:chaperonin GroEL (HSP60 family)
LDFRISQDEEVGDGTTSVIILAGEMLSVAEQFLTQQMHPTVIISAYRLALEDDQLYPEILTTHLDEPCTQNICLQTITKDAWTF